MKGFLQYTGVLFLVGLLDACSTSAYVEKDNSVNLSTYKTYMWVETRADQNDESKRASSYADIPVHNAVNEQLEKWGWKEVDQDPDVLISYDVFVERTVEKQRDPVYTQPMVRYYYNAYRRTWSPIYYPSQFIGYDEYETPVREGTITITMMDARSDKKIWQGWTTERLSGSGFSNLDVRKSVRSIFKET
jgi:hypothetical protein